MDREREGGRERVRGSEREGERDREIERTLPRGRHIKENFEGRGGEGRE